MVSIHAPASHYDSPIVRFGLRFFAALLMVVGVVGIFPLVQSIREARASRDWPTVSGVIVTSEVERTPDPTHISFQPKVEYSFVAEGRGWSGNRISYAGFGSTKRDAAEAVVSRYPVGSNVLIYYRKSDPNTAVLEPGAATSTYLSILIPPVMVVLGVVIWRAQRRSVKPAERASESRDS
jgi:hypothetical protein